MRKKTPLVISIFLMISTFVFIGDIVAFLIIHLFINWVWLSLSSRRIIKQTIQNKKTLKLSYFNSLFFKLILVSITLFFLISLGLLRVLITDYRELLLLLITVLISLSMFGNSLLLFKGIKALKKDDFLLIPFITSLFVYPLSEYLQVVRNNTKSS
jgi:hypothetical protein